MEGYVSMRFLIYLIYVLIGLGFIYELLTRKYKSIYSCNMVIGRPGCGKSTMYAKLAHNYLSRGFHVYGTDPITVYIKDRKTRKKIPVQVKEIKMDQLYRYQFPENSVILCDEAGTIFASRSWKSFDKRNISFFKRYRHDKLIIWFWSQSFDIDIVIRNLVSQFWICEKYLRCWTVARRLIMKPVVVHAQGDAPSSIQDDFVEDPKLLRPVLGGMMVTFIPHWVNWFDSYEIPDSQRALRDIDYSLDPVPYPAGARTSKLRGRYADAKRRVILFVRALHLPHFPAKRRRHNRG